MISLGRIWSQLHPFLPRNNRIGVVVAPSWITATLSSWSLRGRRPARVITRAVESTQETSSAFVDVLDELRGELVSDEPLVYVALAKPFARAKVVELPPVGRSVVRQLMTRNAGKYFLLQGEASVIADAVALRPSWRRTCRRWIAGYADEEVVEATTSAIQEAGCRLGSITSASCALLEGLLAVDETLRTQRAVIKVETEEWTEEIHLRGGRPEMFLPVVERGEAHSPDGVDRTETAGPGNEGNELEFRSFHFGRPEAVKVEGDGEPCDRTDSDAGMLAAFGAVIGSNVLPLLVTSRGLATLEHRKRVRIATICALSLVLVGTAGLLQLWGLDREIQAVTTARAVISAKVEQAASVRKATIEDRAWLDSLSRSVEDARDHSVLLAEIAQALPESSFLRTYHATATEVRITGETRSGANIVAALEASERFDGISFNLESSERPPDGNTRFELTAALQEESKTARRVSPGHAMGSP